MGVQVIGSGGQTVTAVGVPTKRVDATAVRIVGAGAGGGFDGVHNDLSGRSTADAHPISAITGLQTALDALGTTSEMVTTSTALTGSPRTIALSTTTTPITVTLPAATAADSGKVWYFRNLNIDATATVSGLAEGDETIPALCGLVIAGVESAPATYVWLRVGFLSSDGSSGGASALADLTDVDTTTDPPAQDDVLAWDAVGSKWTPATLDGGVALSDAAPQDLGTAAAGVSTDASRADHVHDMPTAADVGALVEPAGTATDGYVIASDSGTPTWTAATGGGGGGVVVPLVSGEWSWTASTHGGRYTGAQAVSGGAADAVWMIPFLPGQACTITAIRAYVHNSPTAGAVYRFGAYTMSTGIVSTVAGLVGALVADAGTVAAASTGWKSITGLSIAVPATGIWVAFAAQSVGATAPSVTVAESGGVASQMNAPYMLRDTEPAYTNRLGVRSETGITGAFPSSVTCTSQDFAGFTTLLPMLQVKVTA